MSLPYAARLLTGAIGWIPVAYLIMLVALVLRLEFLKRRGSLPQTFTTFLSAKLGPDKRSDTWTRMRAQGNLVARCVWLSLFLLSSQHLRINDRLTSRLVYASRALLGLSLLLGITVLLAR